MSSKSEKPETTKEPEVVEELVLDFLPYDGKDPRKIAGLNVKKCTSCKLTFGDLGIGRCPSCNSHMIKDA